MRETLRGRKGYGQEGSFNSQSLTLGLPVLKSLSLTTALSDAWDGVFEP